MKTFVLAVACIFLTLTATGARATITIVHSQFNADVSADLQIALGTAIVDQIPAVVMLDVSAGTAFSKNTIDWSLIGNQTVLSFVMDHQLGGSASVAGGAEFIANTNEPYALSGYYNATDVVGSGLVSQYARLSDETDGTILFDNTQKSLSTTNEQFVLGGLAGDSNNNLVGSLTGNLIAGHSYILSLEYQVMSDENSHASALGNLTLGIGTVPEPSTLMMCSAAIFAAQLRRRKLVRHNRI